MFNFRQFVIYTGLFLSSYAHAQERIYVRTARVDDKIIAVREDLRLMGIVCPTTVANVTSAIANVFVDMKNQGRLVLPTARGELKLEGLNQFSRVATNDSVSVLMLDEESTQVLCNSSISSGEYILGIGENNQVSIVQKLSEVARRYNFQSSRRSN